MKLSRGAALLLVPGLGVFLVLLVLPLANIVEESFRLFEPGRIGAAKDAPYTLFNYAELAEPAYLYYFVETVRFGLISSVIALLIAFPIAYLTARQPSPMLRRLAIGFLIGLMFLSTLVRVYALQLTFGPTGFARLLAGFLGMSPNGRALHRDGRDLRSPALPHPDFRDHPAGHHPEHRSAARRGRAGTGGAALEGPPDRSPCRCACRGCCRPS